MMMMCFWFEADVLYSIFRCCVFATSGIRQPRSRTSKPTALLHERIEGRRGYHGPRPTRGKLISFATRPSKRADAQLRIGILPEAAP